MAGRFPNYLILLHMVGRRRLTVELSIRPDLISQLVPQHARPSLLAKGIDVNNFTPIEILKLITLGEQQ